ncbi:MAG: hypothetical protein R3F23_02255 [Verrucomicrobiia bacterium]
MALKPSKKNKVFEKITSQPITLKILDPNNQSTLFVPIASFYDAIKATPKLIGKQEKGKNYIFKSQAEIHELLQQAGLKTVGTSQEAAAYVINNPAAYQEMPANYSESYIAQDGKLLTQGQFEPQHTQDHFFIQISDPSLIEQNSVTVKVETANPNNPKSAYHDSATITLNRISSGVFRSDPLTLTGKPVFDQNPIQGQKDNSPQDQTFLAELGSTLRVSYQSQAGQTITTQAYVPVKQVLPIKIINYKNNNGTPFFTPEEIRQQIANLQEIYAQAGIQVEIQGEVIEKDLPQGINLNDGLSFEEGKILASETASDFSPKDGIRILLIGDSFAKKGVAGTSIAITTPNTTPNMHNTVFIPRNAGPNVLAHETMHCIIEDAVKNNLQLRQSIGHTEKGAHHNAPHNLMYWKTNTTQLDIFGAFHLSTAQINATTQSSLLKAPSSPRYNLIEYQTGFHFSPKP